MEPLVLGHRLLPGTRWCLWVPGEAQWTPGDDWVLGDDLADPRWGWLWRIGHSSCNESCLWSWLGFAVRLTWASITGSAPPCCGPGQAQAQGQRGSSISHLVGPLASWILLAPGALGMWLLLFLLPDTIVHEQVRPDWFVQRCGQKTLPGSGRPCTRHRLC